MNFELSDLDCLIVLGARLNPAGEPGRVARLRLTHALHCWRRHCPGSRVILTGGVLPGQGRSEARAMADWALNWAAEQWGEEARKTLESCLLVEEASRNTAASALNTLPLLQSLNLRAVGLVTDAVHIHRAGFIFRRRLREHGILLHPLPARGLVRHYWRQRRYLWLAKMALREGGAWVKVLGNYLLGRSGRKY